MSFATVSILTSPDQFSPVNTDGLWFQLNSASYSEPNYKYLVDVFIVFTEYAFLWGL